MIVEVVGGGGRGGGRETPEHRMMMAGSVARVPVWSILPRFVFEQSFLGGGKFGFFFFIIIIFYFLRLSKNPSRSEFVLLL